ncbi:MAG TPA: D-aminoacyl-tRNA deacylase, partial [Chryseosolibacter sp.]|nr:D-aminoacyl-tRNA deacylase [Chryseosolibacter sp.]
MIAVIQRVSSGSVEIDHQTVASIGKGLVVLVGIEDADNEDDIGWLAAKIVHLRIFNDQAGVRNMSAKDCDADV